MIHSWSSSLFHPPLKRRESCFGLPMHHVELLLLYGQFQSRFSPIRCVVLRPNHLMHKVSPENRAELKWRGVESDHLSLLCSSILFPQPAVVDGEVRVKIFHLHIIHHCQGSFLEATQSLTHSVKVSKIFKPRKPTKFHFCCMSSLGFT